MPFALPRFQKDFEASEWARVQPIVESALSIEEICGADSPEEAYLETGIRTVERADVIIAVWDGQPAAGIGGTGDIVEYARSLEKPLILINPETGTQHEEQFDQLPSVTPGADWDANQPRLAVEREYAELNCRAESEAPRARQFVIYVILLNLIASACGIIISMLQLGGGANIVLTAIKFAVLAGALSIVFFHRRVQRAWIRNRIAAEICRSFLAIWRLRRPLVSLPRIMAPGFEDLGRSLELAWHLDATAVLPLDEARRTYLQERIETQRNYFDQNYQFTGRWTTVLKTGANLATALAIVFGLIGMAATTANGPVWIDKVSKLLSVVLPLLPPILLSTLAIQDMPRRAQRNRIMTAKLEAAAKRIHNTKTWLGLSRAVIEVEEFLLQEVVEWHSVKRFSGPR